MDSVGYGSKNFCFSSKLRVGGTRVDFSWLFEDSSKIKALWIRINSYGIGWLSWMMFGYIWVVRGDFSKNTALELWINSHKVCILPIFGWGICFTNKSCLLHAGVMYIQGDKHIYICHGCSCSGIDYSLPYALFGYVFYLILRIIQLIDHVSTITHARAIVMLVIP